MSVDAEDFNSAYARAIGIFTKSKDNIEIPALKTLEGAFKKRIHNDRKDSNLMKIGLKGPRGINYTEPYRKKKSKITGNPTGNAIDLFLTGDTMRNIVVGKSSNQNVLGFLRDKSRLIAERQEENYNTVIFKPSKVELRAFTRVYLDRFKKEMEKAFDTAFS